MKRFSKNHSEPRLWQFYYENEVGQHISVGVIRCKEPQRTKKYKRSLLRLGRPNVRVIGFHAMDEKSFKI